jgi:hypothetical protein
MNFIKLAIMISRAKQITESVIKPMTVLITIIGLLPLPCHGQADTVKSFKNTIRVNLTNPMLFGSDCNIIGYERVIKDYQTASISFGRMGFPKFNGFDTDSLGIKNQYKDKGFNLAFDYRFYLQKENKYKAPKGIYLGPYYAYNYISRDITWDVNTTNFTGEVNTDIKLTANLVGLQLGYQFVLWKRMSIDMILMGPGLWFLGLKTDFDTSMPPEDEAMLLEKINEMLKEKFPGSDLVLQGGGFEAKKTTNTSSMGFRYMINLGFRF